MSDVVGRLAEFVAVSRRLAVLTGAGCSTESGIPDYRDDSGEWKRPQPVQYRDFVQHDTVRQRYWARSMLGWRRIAAALPNPAHIALAAMEAAGHIHHLITQNVDGLHQKAGHRGVTDLHGRLDTVACLSCGRHEDRDVMQQWLEQANPDWSCDGLALAPDGDVDLEGADYDAYRVPDCPTCGGVLKPAVVFFGENVPRNRVADAFARLHEADALLVVGSSLMVFSGFRFARTAARYGLPVAAVNLGRTRADELIDLKIESRCGELLPVLVAAMEQNTGPK